MQSSSAAAKATKLSSPSGTPTRPSASGVGGEALAGGLTRTQRSPSLSLAIPAEPSTPRTGGATADRSFNLSRTTPTVHIPSPIREFSSLQATPLSAANTSSSSAATSPVSPGRARQGSQTHAGGILPPASFFRPSKPNSATNQTSGGGSFNFPGSPPKSSPRRQQWHWLAVQGELACCIASSAKGQWATEHVQDTQSRFREQQTGNRTQSSLADTSASSAGVRGSFERMWRRGGPETPGTATPRRSVDRRSEKSVPAGVVEETEVDGNNNMDLEAGRKSGDGDFNDDATPQPSPLPEDRNRFAQDDID
ncbi:hypothetical protein FRC04_006962 [Tulasnella sp. 424]|nr:hypothetical protein FRC04_006962 [Tulasnella sp. 424]